MYDSNDNIIAYAGDSYHLIAQDSHGIYVNNSFTYDMKGLVEFWGESYEIYNENEIVATVEFNGANTTGRMYNVKRELIAEYNSEWIFKDFDIKIYENCELDDISVIMIFCSYYSDYSSDHSN